MVWSKNKKKEKFYSLRLKKRGGRKKKKRTFQIFLMSNRVQLLWNFHCACVVILRLTSALGVHKPARFLKAWSSSDHVRPGFQRGAIGRGRHRVSVAVTMTCRVKREGNRWLTSPFAEGARFVPLVTAGKVSLKAVIVRGRASCGHLFFYFRFLSLVLFSSLFTLPRLAHPEWTARFDRGKSEHAAPVCTSLLSLLHGRGETTKV